MFNILLVKAVANISSNDNNPFQWPFCESIFLIYLFFVLLARNIHNDDCFPNLSLSGKINSDINHSLPWGIAFCSPDCVTDTSVERILQFTG